MSELAKCSTRSYITVKRCYICGFQTELWSLAQRYACCFKCFRGVIVADFYFPLLFCVGLECITTETSVEMNRVVATDIEEKAK